MHVCDGQWFTEGSATLLVCPGIANSAESDYVRTFIYHAQQNGFRVAVLNHLGALRDVPLTSPRIFTYGQSAATCYLRASCQHILFSAPSVCLSARNVIWLEIDVTW